MVNSLEKSLKRWLKRKVKITLGTIVAFLLSCNFVMADTAYFGVGIIDKDNGVEILESKDFNNSFENGIYTNNSIIKETSLSIEGISGNYGIFNYFSNDIPLSIINNGEINISSTEKINTGGIYTISTGTSGVNIVNNGNIITKNENQVGRGIWNEPLGGNINIENIINTGKVIIKTDGSSGTAYGIGNTGISSSLKLSKIANDGIIFVENKIGNAYGIYNNRVNNDKNITGVDIENNGIIVGKGLYSGGEGINLSKSLTNNIENTGIISGVISGDYQQESSYIFKARGISNFGTISNDYGIIKKLSNDGLISGYGIATEIHSSQKTNNGCGEGIHNDYKNNIEEIVNSGTIYGYGNNTTNGENYEKGGFGLFNIGKIKSLSNKGVIFGRTNAVFNGAVYSKDGEIDNFENYGLLINREMTINKQPAKIVEDATVTNYGLMFTVKDDGTYELDKENTSVENKNVINAKLTSDNKGTESISVDNYSDKYINGITDTLKVDKNAEIKNSVINSYTNAIVFAEKPNVIQDGETDKKEGYSLTLTDTTVNGGLINISDTESSLGTAILGSDSGDKLTLVSSSDENKTVINGNIVLGKGEDNLTVGDNVQINGTIDGGEDTDTLTFGLVNSTKLLGENNTNILHNISGFENINVNNNITLFENIKVTGAENITIGENGNLVLRIDGTDNNSHALKDNEGVISSNGGKLLFALNGVGEGATIDLGNNTLDETMKGNEIGYAEDITIDTTSLLHNIARGEGNTLTVNTVENLPEKDIPENINYAQLNKIYQSIRSVDKVGEFNVDGDEKLTAFTKYLHDIYAANPYAYSSELSRKTMGMMRDIADKDLHPDLKEWAIFGGLTHIDGGTENSYYGKGYYSYDIGSRDISADTKITGAYVKGEYGKAEDLTLGVILGGNSSETEIENSKVEGDSFYLGGYAKKYLNNFRFTLGAGIHRGDYEADRVAVGYDGITETRKFSENYGDRGFNLYGNVKYSQELGNGFYFEPSVTLDYSYVDQEGVKESGDLAIDVDSEKFDYTSGIVNLDIRKEFVGEKAKHSLIAGVSYERILSGEDEKHITGRFKGGTDFDILVPEKEKDNFALNVKYEVETEKGILFDVKGSYKFEHDSNKDQWIVGTGIGYRF